MLAASRLLPPPIGDAGREVAIIFSAHPTESLGKTTPTTQLPAKAGISSRTLMVQPSLGQQRRDLIDLFAMHGHRDIIRVGQRSDWKVGEVAPLSRVRCTLGCQHGHPLAKPSRRVGRQATGRRTALKPQDMS